MIFQSPAGAKQQNVTCKAWTDAKFIVPLLKADIGQENFTNEKTFPFILPDNNCVDFDCSISQNSFGHKSCLAGTLRILSWPIWRDKYLSDKSEKRLNYWQ
jgi:hypothetical protein